RLDEVDIRVEADRRLLRPDRGTYLHLAVADDERLPRLVCQLCKRAQHRAGMHGEVMDVGAFEGRPRCQRDVRGRLDQSQLGVDRPWRLAAPAVLSNAYPVSSWPVISTLSRPSSPIDASMFVTMPFITGWLPSRRDGVSK